MKKRCGKCNQLKVEYGFISLSQRYGGTGEEMCASCCCKHFAELDGDEIVESLDFDEFAVEDAFGKMRRFFVVPNFFVGVGMEAVELLPDGTLGYQFAVVRKPGTSVTDVYRALREKVQMAVRISYLKSTSWDDAENRLYVRGSAINGRIEDRCYKDETKLAAAIVDGKEYTWDEIGEYLTSHTGFNFRIEIFDKFDSMPLSPDPLADRPDSTPWIPKNR
jgi:hypothetical protein